MNDTQFVDALTQFWENVGSGETAQDTEVQTRNTFFAQQAVSRFWHWRPWPWKQRTDTVTLVAGDADLPDDFGTFGQQGAVFVNATTHEVFWRPIQEVLRARQGISATTTRPSIYSVRSIASLAVGTPLISVAPLSTATLKLFYDAKAPTVDYAGPDFALDQIPVQYHETVLFDLACARLAFGEGDPRAAELENRALRGMAEAWAEERPGLNQPRRTPAYGRRLGRYYA